MTIKAVRKYSGFYWRNFFTINLLNAMNLTVFFMDHYKNVNGRLGVSVTILISMIAFQFIVRAKIPAIPYLTFADKYVMYSFSLVFLVVLYSCIASADYGFVRGSGENPIVSPAMDASIAIAFTSYMIFGELAFVMYSRILLKRHESTLDLSYTDMQRLGLAPDRSNAKTFTISVSKRNTRILY